MIVRVGSRYYVKSEDGSKNLGGPYVSHADAEKRLAQIEMFKAMHAAGKK